MFHLYTVNCSVVVRVVPEGSMRTTTGGGLTRCQGRQMVSMFLRHFSKTHLTTFGDGCLGSNNDEGRSEVR